MDIIPLNKYIFALTIFGFLFFFFNILSLYIISVLDITNIYFSAGVWFISISPAIVFLAASLRFIMQMQKRGGVSQ